MKTTRVKIDPKRGSDGLKTEEAWLAEALGAKWTHRNGYTVASANRAAQWETLKNAGFKASRRYFVSDKTPYRFTHAEWPNELYTLNEALKLARELIAETERK